ncbi:MAG: putative signal transduction protein [Herbinix sp.]|jgi:diguanylate cyclase (GGDEF)-like protein|nr:putative signal transduction protein [Herbinix sp.]
MYDNEIKDILDKLDIFERAYDQIRLIDPIAKKIVEYKEKIVNETNFSCYHFWRKNKVCDNCVSMRAYRENDTFIKMEYTNDEIYMVTAIPIELNNRIVVLELIKNITNSMSVDVVEKETIEQRTEVNSMLDNIHNMALVDSLTGIYNRRYINERLPINIVNTTLTQQCVSVIMADIDLFKNVNDTYGHLVGDSTLIFFANVLKSCLKRQSDWVARYGGEEFLICLPGAGLSTAAEIAEQMRSKLETSEIFCGEFKFYITASFGISTMGPERNLSMEELIDAADKKLYLAKHNGRNRIEY